MILEDCSGCGLKGWGWQDNGYGVATRRIYFATTGPQRLRVQAREDGAAIDQIVLFAVAHIAVAPGALKDDTTILAATNPVATTEPPPPPPGNVLPTVALTSPAEGAVFTAPASLTLSATAADVDGTVVTVDFYVGSTVVASDAAAPYATDWSGSAGVYTLTAIATDNTGSSTTSSPVSIQLAVAPPPPPPPPQPPPPPPADPQDEIVLHAAAATNIVGNWQSIPDATAASGVRMQNTDLQVAKVPVAAAPAHAFELTFDAQAGRPYHLWLRMKALMDFYGNDSVYVQFDASVNATGAPISRIGSLAAESVLLENCSGCGVQGWGWQDNGYTVPASPIYFATSGPQRLRIQVREDGAAIDQVVLSALTYATASPGTLKNDTTILAATATPPGEDPPPPGQHATVGRARRAGSERGLHLSGFDRSDGDRARPRRNDRPRGVQRREYAARIRRQLAVCGHVAKRSAGCVQPHGASHRRGRRQRHLGGHLDRRQRARWPTAAVARRAGAVRVESRQRRRWLDAAGRHVGGRRVPHAECDLRAPKASASATPTSSFDLVFDADAGQPYYLWVRGRALNNDLSNDSVYVQFDGTVDASGNAISRIASTSAQSVLLEHSNGCGIKSWGWTDNAYGAAGTPIYFATSGTQRLRIQPREDGLAIDQVVLSKAKYTGNAPGSPKNDIVILPPTN